MGEKGKEGEDQTTELCVAGSCEFGMHGCVRWCLLCVCACVSLCA